MTLRVAIVGCGKSAENHVSEIRKLPCAQLVGVCDSEPLMAEQFSIRHDISVWYSDLGRLLLEQHPDVVHIATPPQSHLDVALQAIEAGCHLFVEKPLAENARQASRLVRTARANGCKLTIGWTHYFDPAMQAARSRIAQGVIGSVVHLEAFTAYDLGSGLRRRRSPRPDALGASFTREIVSEQSRSHPRCARGIRRAGELRASSSSLAGHRFRRIRICPMSFVCRDNVCEHLCVHPLFLPRKASGPFSSE